jgi:DNA-binding winged helix-turn-helix (wHTH) protein/Tol biopolymer transport system component
MMSLPAKSQSLVRFGEFQLDFESAELRSNGNKTSLQGQPLQILAVLLENPGRLVTRDELKKRLWPSDTFVDFDQSLNRAVNRLREALADSAEQPRFVETLPRRGYRFIAPVTKDGLGEAAVPEQAYPPSAAAAMDHSPTTSSVQSPTLRWRRQFVVTGILAILLILGLVAVSTWRWQSRSQAVSFENLEISKLTDNGAVKNVAISHDGRYVAYAVYAGEKQALRLRQIATHSDIEVLAPDAGNFVGLTFSPDGNYIYCVRSDRNDISFRYLYVIPSSGGTPRKLVTDVDSGIGFSPDGRMIVYEHSIRNEMELKTANNDGTDQRLLAVVHDANFLTPGDPGPTWSPDGRTITFSKLLVGRPRGWVLFAVSAQDGRIRELYSANAALGRPVWLPTGRTLVVPQYDRILNRTQLWTVSFPSGKVRRFTHDISDYSMDLDLTNDGRILAAITGAVQSQIWASSSADHKSIREITNGDPPIMIIKEMPNSKILASDSDGALWTMNQDGSQRTIFGNLRNVSWFTMCGHFVVATTNEPNSTALVRLNEDGTQMVTLATGNLWSPTCSLEGRFVFYANWEEPQKIWRISIDGGSPVEVARILGDCIMGNVTVSPDGKFIAYPYTAYTGTPPGRHLVVIPATGGLPLKQFDMQGDSWSVGPYWTSDGTALRYLQLRDGVSNVWEQPLLGGEPRQLTRFTSGRIFNFAWSEDEKRLFLTRGSASSDVVLLTGFH